MLVILGLLAGGILTGQSLIRAAELRAIPVEFQQYQLAATTFLGKFRGLPGDLRNATDFFGAAATCPPTSSSPLTGRETCNGDGNGRLYNASTTNEYFTFFQHLASGGMIEGSYTGASGSGVYNSYHPLVGVNHPESRIGKAGWTVWDIGEPTIAETAYVEGYYGHSFIFGEFNAAGQHNHAPVLTPEEAWNLDTKVDDGNAGTGKVVIWEGYNTSCFQLADGSAGSWSNAAPRSDIKYNLTDKVKRCSIIFRDVF